MKPFAVPLFALVLGSLTPAQHERQEKTTEYVQAEAIFNDWVVSCRDTGDADSTDPRYQQLLALPDADLFFSSRAALSEADHSAHFVEGAGSPEDRAELSAASRGPR